MLTDLRCAFRSFLKTPGFTSIVVLTLALGIGANTAIFTVVNAVLLRGFPYEDADRLLRVRRGTSYPDLQDWQRETQSFSEIAGFRPQLFDYSNGQTAERVDGALVTGGAMAMFGAQPLLGRTIRAEDDASGTERIAVVSASFWSSRLGSDPGVVGRRVTFNGLSYTIAGVVQLELPATRAHIFAPFVPESGREATARGAHTLRAFVRLKPGVTADRAQHEMDALALRLEQLYPQSNRDVRFRLQPLDDSVVGSIRPALRILLATVAFVLLIACVNVTNLLMARGAARRAELAVRAAIGATRGRIVRQLLTESFLLAGAGGILGLLLGYALTGAIVRLAPESVPRLEGATLDASVLGFTAAIALLTALLFGALPAWTSSTASLADAARGDARTTRRGSRSRAVLIVAETALALVLLVGAGLLVRSFMALTGQRTGFDASKLLTGNITLTGERYGLVPVRTRFYAELEERLRSLPGVRGVAMTTDLPIGGSPIFHNFAFEGRPMAAGTEPEVYYRAVNPGYFDTLRIPIVRGRAFTTNDRDGNVPVAIVNEAFVREYYPNEEALGRRVRWVSGDAGWITIVGVCADVRALSLDQGEVPAIHVPYMQESAAWRRWIDVAVRVDGNPMTLAGSLGAEVSRLDRNVPVVRVRSMEQVLAASLADRRFNLFLLGGFATLALVLASAGTYGVMSYLVLQRTRELGVRMALGARASDVLALIAGRGMVPAVVGVAVGLLVASVASRVLASMLFNVTPTDALTLFTSAGILLLSAAAAAYVPARRAMRIDPVTALRSE